MTITTHPEIQPNPDISPLPCELLEAWGKLPTEYRGTTAAQMEAAISEDARELQSLPGVTHGTIHESLDYARGLAIKKIGSESEELSYVSDRLSNVGTYKHLGERVAIETPHARIAVSVMDDGCLKYLNLATGNKTVVHSVLLDHGLIGNNGFYGAHPDRSSPRDISETLEITPSIIPDDDPIRKIVRTPGQYQKVSLTTAEQLQRFLNLREIYPRFERPNIQPASDDVANTGLRRLCRANLIPYHG